MEKHQYRRILFFVLALAIVAFLWMNNLNFTGYSVKEDYQDYRVEKEFTANDSYDLELDERISSLRISGEARGNVSIFLVKDNEEKLIFETERQDSGVSRITGRAVDDLKQNESVESNNIGKSEKDKDSNDSMRSGNEDEETSNKDSATANVEGEDNSSDEKKDSEITEEDTINDSDITTKDDKSDLNKNQPNSSETGSISNNAEDSETNTQANDTGTITSNNTSNGSADETDENISHDNIEQESNLSNTTDVNTRHNDASGNVSLNATPENASVDSVEEKTNLTNATSPGTGNNDVSGNVSSNSTTSNASVSEESDLTNSTVSGPVTNDTSGNVSLNSTPSNASANNVVEEPNLLNDTVNTSNNSTAANLSLNSTLDNASVSEESDLTNSTVSGPVTDDSSGNISLNSTPSNASGGKNTTNLNNFSSQNKTLSEYEITAECQETCNLDNFDLENATLKIVVGNNSRVKVDKLHFKKDVPVFEETIEDINSGNNSYSLDAEEYFSGAQDFETECEGNVSVGAGVSFYAKADGEGICRVIAHNNAGKAKSNYFNVSLKENITYTALESQLVSPIRAGENVSWEMPVEVNGAKEEVVLPVQAFDFRVRGGDIINVTKVESEKRVHPAFNASEKVKKITISGEGGVTLRYKTPAPELAVEKIDENEKVIGLEQAFNYRVINVSLPVNESYEEFINLTSEVGRADEIQYHDPDDDGLIEKLSFLGEAGGEYKLSIDRLNVGEPVLNGRDFSVPVQVAGNGKVYVESHGVIFENVTEGDVKVVTQEGELVPYRVYELKRKIEKLD